MTFEPQRAGQLDGLSEGDHVAFEFVETDDARRVLTRIERQP
jgi:Cu/Ag efflux protein CusF